MTKEASMQLRRILTAILLTLILHGAFILLSWHRFSNFQMSLPPGQQSVKLYSIEIENIPEAPGWAETKKKSLQPETEANTEKTVPENQPLDEEEKDQTAVQSSDTRLGESIKSPAEIKTQRAPENFGDEGSSTITELNEDLFLMELLRRIGEEIRYPPLAMRKKWEGTVFLKVTISAKGELMHMEMTKSSGYTVLDKSAQSLIQSIFPLYHGPTQDRSFAVPIKFSIN